jgi:hypothetical protein
MQTYKLPLVSSSVETGFPSSMSATLPAKAGPLAGAAPVCFSSAALAHHPFKWHVYLVMGAALEAHSQAVQPPPLLLLLPAADDPPPPSLRSEYREQSGPMPIKTTTSSATGSSSSSWGGSSGRLQPTPAARSHPVAHPLYVESLYSDAPHNHSVAGGGGASSSNNGSDGSDGRGTSSRKGVTMSVSGMEQKLAELLLLSNSPDIDAGRIMAAAG